MSDWWFWGLIAAGIAVSLKLLNIATLIKSIWPDRAKPQLSDAQDCFVRVYKNCENASFDLLVDNAGSKDCSVISVELKYREGCITNFIYEPPLPMTISPGRTERIVVAGYAFEENRFKLQPEQQSVKATAFVKFNRGKIIEKKISFIIKYYT